MHTATAHSNDLSSLFNQVVDSYNTPEDTLVTQLLSYSQLTFEHVQPDIEERARHLIEQIRACDQATTTVNLLLRQYSLNSEEGLVLMCLAEALLRIPDKATALALIEDQISDVNWQEHLGQSESFLINMSSWGLIKQGESLSDSDSQKASGLISRMVGKLGQPLLRSAIFQAMKMMTDHFIAGNDIDQAILNTHKSNTKKPYIHDVISYDLTYEPALSDKVANANFDAIEQAVEKLAHTKDKQKTEKTTDYALSIKLSSLHAKFDVRHKNTVQDELLPKLVTLVKLARQHDIAITFDAEHTDKLEISLLLFKALYQNEVSRGYNKLGIAVQAYSKQALPTLRWLSALAKAHQDKIHVRLVKGAYWDNEIKQAQQSRLNNYPVFTEKEHTELSYFNCAQYMLTTQASHWLEPTFATHNAYTICSLIALANHIKNSANSQNLKRNPLRLQRLQGVAESLFNQLAVDQALVKAEDSTQTEEAENRIALSLSLYAPVGQHQQLSPYLMRRLLESGDKASQLYRLTDTNTSINTLIQSPIEHILHNQQGSNSAVQNGLTLPCEVFLPARRLCEGIAIGNKNQRRDLIEKVSVFERTRWNYGNGDKNDQGLSVVSPYNIQETIGCIAWRDGDDAARAMDTAALCWEQWQHSKIADRIALLNTIADYFEARRYEFIVLCAKELGFTWLNGQQEVHRAIDYCRYYAEQAEKLLSSTRRLPGLTGEINHHYYRGRGIYFCISPWHSPLATFVGQIVAGIVAGNCIIAKPAEQSGLIALRSTELMHEAGVPAGVLQCLPGSGTVIGQAILNDDRLKGVVFTGSPDRARDINQILANRPGPITPMMADTGGQNAMIVDSTARPEEVVRDIMHSAFNRAGQRASSLRLVCLQDEIYDEVVSLLRGAMKRFVVGSPEKLDTDCGPVIDKEAYDRLNQYIHHWRQQGWVLAEAPKANAQEQGYYISPIAIGLEKISELDKEQFGPILHVYRYQSQDRLKIVDRINRTNYGLTLSIHSRNPKTASEIESHMRVGNCYINRHQIDAVIGSQPFGGQGLSGTGPKSGGPDYLKFFCSERVTCTNTSAVGIDFDLWR